MSIIAAHVTTGELLRYRLLMTKLECPMCHSPLISAGKLRYCAQCGWQKEQTEKQLRLNLKMVPIAFAVMTLILMALFLRSGARTQNGWLLAVFLSFPLIALVITYAVTRRNLKILLAQPPPSSAMVRAVAEAATEAARSAALSPKYQAVLKTVPPRRLRLSRRGTFNLSLTLIVLLIFAGIMAVQLYRAWGATHSFTQFGFREWGMAGFALLLLLMLIWQWRVLDRERDLLVNGEVATAKILEKLGSRSASAVKYEFQDSMGEKHVKIGTDYTQRLEVGMNVPVFYDRQNPNRQVPACGAFHEVISQAAPDQ